MRVLASLLVTISLVLPAGCQIAGPDYDNSELDALEKQILEMVGNAPADSLTSCKTIAFGSKPCGGPWGYLVYSSESTDSQRLEELVTAYNQLQRELNRDQGLVSDCAIVPEPEVILYGGYCRAVADR